MALTLVLAVGCTSGDDPAEELSDRASSSSQPGSTATTTAPSATAPTDTAPAAGVTSGASGELFESICDGAPDIADVGTILSPEITEASGLAASRVNPDAWWINNDSGDSARLFAIDGSGALLATVSLQGAEARDWEDLAVGPPMTAGAGTVYVGDTGDNAVMRGGGKGRGTMRVFRFTEPVLDRDNAPQDLDVSVDTLHFEFPDGPHDVEAMVVDPVDGDLLVVTKDWRRTGAAAVFRAPAELVDGSTTVLEAVGSVPLDPGTLVTAADVTPDGSLVALRSYGAVHLYRRPTGEPLWSAFETVPCEGPVPTELQGESLGFAPDGSWYLTVSEGQHATLHRTG